MMSKPVILTVEPEKGAPGTKVTITGHNFGNSIDDILGLFICKTDCSISLKWHSSTCISAVTRKNCKSKGKVKILTKSGESDENIVFTGYIPSVKPQTEIGCWVEETITLIDEEKIEEVETNDLMGISKSEYEFNLESFSQFKNKSYDISNQNFSPEYFLIKYYHRETLEDFKKALNNLKLSKISSDEHNYKTFLEMNIVPIFRSLEVFNSMYSAMIVDNTSFNLNAKLSELIQIANSESSLMFDDKIRKKERIDQIRNAQFVFKKYKDLFMLPKNLEECFNTHSYKDAANLYKSVTKSYPSLKNFNYAKAYLDKSKALMEAKRANLEVKLLIFPSDFDEHKQILLFLSSLDQNRQSFYKWSENYIDYIESYMMDLYSKYIALDNNHDSEENYIYEYSIYRDFIFKTPVGQCTANQYNEELLKIDMPPGIEMIRELSQFITTNFLNFWKMCMLSYQSHFESKDLRNSSENNQKFVEFGNRIFSKFITLFMTVIQPEGKRSMNFFDETQLKWSNKFAKHIQFWYPLILVYFDNIMISLNDVDSVMLKQIDEFYISLKALSTLRLVRLTSQLIKSLSTNFDVGLLIKKNDIIYSSFVDIYYVVLINLCNLLTNSFSKTTLNHSIFFSEWQSKIQESFTYLFYSIEFPISNIFNETQANRSQQENELVFKFSGANSRIRNNPLIAHSVALTSFLEIKKVITSSIKEKYASSGYEGIEIFDYLSQKFDSLYSDCSDRLIRHASENLFKVCDEIFYFKNELKDIKTNEFKRDNSKINQMKYACIKLFAYVVKIKFILNSLNPSIYKSFVPKLLAKFADYMKNNQKILDSIRDSKMKFSFFSALLQILIQLNSQNSQNNEFDHVFKELSAFMHSLENMPNFDAKLKQEYGKQISENIIYKSLIS